MRERAMRADDRLDDLDNSTERGRLSAVLSWMWRRPLDAGAATLAAVTAIAIMINALFMQSGPHPAPIFAHRSTPVVVTETANPIPRPRPTEVAAPARARPEIVADLQRELSKRGFYEGAADGVYGPKTDIAIRDFEQAAGLKPSAEPNDALLQSVMRSPVKAKPVAAGQRADPIAALLGPDKRLMSVQRALAEYGYGQIKPTGVQNAETRGAIERFERERKLPASGQLSDRLVRELSALTGRPLE